MSRTLFWEEEVPGRTQLKVTIVSSENLKGITYYEIQVHVSSSANDESARVWSVQRRYREFYALHSTLSELGFPCPLLPPKQLWGGHTATFIIKRQEALDVWIQAVVIVWQSVSPVRPRVAYAIGELLEAFLCSPDSEAFHRVLVEIKNESAYDEIESQLPDLEPPISPFVSHVAASEKPRSSTSQNGSQAEGQVITFQQVAQQKKLRAKRQSGTSVIVEDQASSFSDVPSLHRGKDQAQKGYEEKEKISRSAPPEPAPDFMAGSVPNYRESWIPNPAAPHMGIAVTVNPLSSPSAQNHQTEYSTFNTHGQRQRHVFRPFIAEVMFRSGNEIDYELARSSGMIDPCTPVSVPPTPNAQYLFNAQWHDYTLHVLEFVQERLNTVTRNRERRDFNILDRHYPPDEDPGAGSVHGNGGGNASDHDEDDDKGDGGAGGGAASTRPLLFINLKNQSSNEIVEDADAGAGGSAQSGQLPPKHELAARYVQYGEHLIKTILREAEADMLDWQVVSNTKDVLVMRRKRPIRRRYLLRGEGSSVHPSPSPNIQDDAARGSVALAPTMLTLDGSASAASSMASPMPRDPDADCSQHCFMGRGLIDASAEEIFETVRRPEMRHLYDAMLNEELILENLAVGESAPDFANSSVGNVLVYYHLFETNRCFLRYARDFCVVQYAKKVMVGNKARYIVVGASINHPQCPVREDVERATLDLFGWVIEPTGVPMQSKVTYMLHIDFGRSGVPTHLLNTISFRQPLAVHYLRRHLRNVRQEEQLEQARVEAARTEAGRLEAARVATQALPRVVA